MSNSLMALLELLLVFGVVMGIGLHQLRGVKRRKKQLEQDASGELITDTETPQ